MINSKDSPLCGLCKKVVDCPCECHINDITSGYHEEVHSIPIDFKVRKEGKGPKRMDYVMMKQGKLPKTMKFRIRELLRL